MKYILGHQNPDTDAIASALVYETYLHDHNQEAKAIMLGQPNRETEFVIQQADLDYPELITKLEDGSDIVLVDHNEASQSIQNRSAYNIVAIIDHHKIADLQTAGPLMMRVEPVGCTCTVLHEMFEAEGYKPNQTTAKLMVSAILSDTLHFCSPTTTDRDRAAVDALTAVSGIEDIEQYAMAMFDAKSDLTGISASDIVTMDYKIFEMGSKKIGVGVMETTNPSFARAMEDKLREAMKETKESSELDHILFCVVDILNQKNTALVLEEDKKLVADAFGAETIDGRADLGSRVSRKKQIVPALHNICA